MIPRQHYSNARVKLKNLIWDGGLESKRCIFLFSNRRVDDSRVTRIPIIGREILREPARSRTILENKTGEMPDYVPRSEAIARNKDHCRELMFI